ncbi:MAG: heat shock chaperone IbpB [candidate division CPR1 bacterium ADurb.Bin160]|uniref:Heat shock chaperone IbpB n=1 Tax=candidate division CPR1 bacterium ADurb.Bin160 TaxID=1852826 RepID=A0A1V5ZKX5_9BACT|nr:MAG: heat shock chaperone IbpB [candidate division CPR1 bacterium ADurb.Bin160]
MTKNEIRRMNMLSTPSSVEEFVNAIFEDFPFKHWNEITEGYPVTNIYTNEKGDVKYEFALTKFKEQEVNVTIENNILTIEAKRQEKNEEEKDGWKLISGRIKKESFTKRIRIPNHLNADKAEAKFNEGLLIITIPAKYEQGKKRQLLG